MKIAAVQFAVTPGAVESNTEKMLDYLASAHQRGADVVVFPEMSDTGYDMPLILQTAQSWDGGTIRVLREAAKDKNINLVAGVSERTADGVFNSTAIVDRCGD